MPDSKNPCKDAAGATAATIPTYERITLAEFARRLNTTESWLRDQMRSRVAPEDRPPHIRLHEIMFDWDSPELQAWIERKRCCKKPKR